MGDLVEETIKIFKETCTSAKSIVWAGTLGHVECDNFQSGTREVMDAMVSTTDVNQAKSIVIGNASVKCIEEFGIAKETVSYISKGERCSRNVLAGRYVSGIAQLAEK